MSDTDTARRPAAPHHAGTAADRDAPPDHPTILDRADPGRIATDPFPHLVIDDALPADAYRALAGTFPGYNDIAAAGPPPSNQRYPFSAFMIEWAPWMPPAWRAFARTHTSRAFLRQVYRTFAGHWTDAAEAVWAGLEQASLGLFMRDSAEILCDARIELNTPVTERPSSVRGGHLDTPNRLFSALLYMRPADDDTPGGDLALSRFRNGAPPEGVPLDTFAFDDAELETVVTVPYAANRLVIFPNRPTALHGVTPRPLTPWQRNYVFVTAEVEDALF
jgi:hypothetical protein